MTTLTNPFNFGLKSIIAVAALSGCGRLQNDQTTNGVSEMQSALGTIDHSLNEAEASTTIASATNKKSYFAPLQIFKNLLPSAWAVGGICDVNRFHYNDGSNTTVLAGSDCSISPDSTVISTFDGCHPTASSLATLNGDVSLRFDSLTTCNAWSAFVKGNSSSLPTSGTLTRTTSNFVRDGLAGIDVSTSSGPYSNYLGATISGGAQVNFGSGVGHRSLTVTGLRRLATSGSVTVFDYSIHSTSALDVTGSRLGNNRTLVSGGVDIDHNIAKFTMHAQVANLSYTSNCCYPSSGSFSFTYSGSRTGAGYVRFLSSCGQVGVSTNGSTESVQTLLDCQ